MKAQANTRIAKNTAADTLLQQAYAACKRLSAYGWGNLLRAHGLNIEVDFEEFKDELLKWLPRIDRSVPGFEDFSLEGCRGIEPGQPAHSLLYHAFASPQVLATEAGPLTAFPTPAEIELIENLVYGICPPSIQELRVMAGNAPLAVVVFAAEYRPAIGTVHQRYADLCFSRVGVSRVGTAAPLYSGQARGYLPYSDDDAYAIHVLPCRYSAYVAALLPGQKNGFGPLRFIDGPSGDAERLFWVPLHKLFSGSECLRGLTLEVTLTAHHINEKLRRVHRALASEEVNSGFQKYDLSRPPFTQTQDLAHFSPEAADGQGLLIPVARERLVEKARLDGHIVTYRMPKGREPFRSSLLLNPRASGGRSAPEYVHARLRLEKNGKITNLNDRPDMLKVLAAGDYEAVHFVDFTAEGYIEVECPALTLELPRFLAAYSMVSAVDFYPLVKQRELMQWWRQSVPAELEQSIWPSNPGPPLTLADTRYPPNLALTSDKLGADNKPRSVFRPSDNTISAIIGLLGSGTGRLTKVNDLINNRVSSLPDGASGVFAPGWDTSIDRSEEQEQKDGSVLPGQFYFNNYGLGSPFPEDAMLCAALSSFWPAAAPDITRTFAPGKYATATPLTDDVIGQQGDPAWDGIPGPHIPNPAVQEVEYRAIEYADYVLAALDQKFNLSKISRTTPAEYAARTLVMARVYTALGAETVEQKREWALFSFTASATDEPGRVQAEQHARVSLSSEFAYRFEIFKHKPVASKATDFRNKRVGFDKMLTIYADPRTVLMQDANGQWKALRY